MKVFIMQFLIAIVFIAELIILWTLVSWIIRADKQVCAAIVSIDKGRTRLKWNLSMISEITSDINEVIPHILKGLQKTRRNIIIRLLNQGLQSIVLLFFKPKYKKLLLGYKTGIGIMRKLLKV